MAYTSNSALKHMVHKIRKDPTNFLKYWHNKDLVNFLNMFVNKDEELPENWQMKHDKSGKVKIAALFIQNIIRNLDGLLLAACVRCLLTRVSDFIWLKRSANHSIL